MASSCLPCLARILVARHGGAFGPSGNLGELGDCGLGPGEIAGMELEPGQSSRAAARWRLVGYACTNRVSLSFASLTRSGSTMASSVKTSASRMRAA